MAWPEVRSKMARRGHGENPRRPRQFASDYRNTPTMWYGTKRKQTIHALAVVVDMMTRTRNGKRPSGDGEKDSKNSRSNINNNNKTEFPTNDQTT